MHTLTRDTLASLITHGPCYDDTDVLEFDARRTFGPNGESMYP